MIREAFQKRSFYSVYQTIFHFTASNMHTKSTKLFESEIKHINLTPFDCTVIISYLPERHRSDSRAEGRGAYRSVFFLQIPLVETLYLLKKNMFNKATHPPRPS